MITEEFAFGESVIHRMDPRVKVVFAAGFSVITALATRLDVVCAALLTGVVLALLTRLPLPALLKRLVPVNLFVVFLWIFLPFTQAGRTVGHLGPLAVTREGLDLALAITLKSNAIMMVTIAMLTTMSVASMGHALNRLYIPKKIVQLLLLTYRYLFVFEEEYRQMARAARMRSFHPGTNLHTYRTYAYMAAMLLVRAHARALRVHQAMKCRGFEGRFLVLDTLRFSRADKISSAALFLVLLLLAAGSWLPQVTSLI